MRRSLTHPASSSIIEERARILRSRLTPSERALWSALRDRQLGVHFKRQARVGGFIADFVAVSMKLIVEVDGGAHIGRERADARRDRKLARLGYRVVRLDAALVLHNLPEALAHIRAALGAPR